MQRTITCLLLTAALFVSAGTYLEASPDFLREVIDREYAHFEDGLKAVDLLRDGELAEDLSFEDRINQLKEDGIVPSSWERESEDPLTRGELAYMFYRSMDLEGGVVIRIFGVSRRYAYKELHFRRIMTEGMQSRRIDGEELISVLRAASEYQDMHGNQAAETEEEEDE